MDLKLLERKINSFLTLYNDVPQCRREYRKWIRQLVTIGEEVFNILKSREYIDLCDNIKSYKSKFNPKRIRKHLFDNGFTSDV
jgi:hypothetical protein